MLSFLNEYSPSITIIWSIIGFLLPLLSNWLKKNKKNKYLNIVLPLLLMLAPAGVVYSFVALGLPITHISVIIICANISLLFLLMMSISFEFDKFNARRNAQAKYGLFDIDHTDLTPKSSKDKHC